MLCMFLIVSHYFIIVIIIRVIFVHYHCSMTLVVSPGEIVTTPKAKISSIGLCVVFNCTVLGGPTNVYMWTRLSGGVVVSNTPVLNFTVESAFDGSIYQCSVENNAGNISSEVTLNGKYIKL